MNGFGFKKVQKKSSRWNHPMSILWIFLSVLLFFLLLSGVRGKSLWNAYQDGDIRKITDQKEWLGIAGAGLDRPLGHAVNQLLKLVDIYTQNDRDRTADERLIQVLRYLNQYGDDRKNNVPEQYSGLFEMITQVANFEEDIVSLMGFTTPQTYLVLLQNTAEARPNGGFFGSFAVVKVLNGKIADMEIRDSYILGYEKGSNDFSIKGPEWILNYLPHNDIHFVGANKIGFTYLDGDHIKTLYEKVYPGEEIRGVVFLRTDMFEKLIPGFQQKQRERQFTNAATDLIRGTDGFGKKEKYVTEVSNIIKEYSSELIIGAVQQLPELINQGYINIYPHKVSVSGGPYGGGLSGWIRNVGLTTRFEENMMYSWDANVSYNKIDNFIQKKVTILNDDGVIYYQGDTDRVDISGLDEGERTIRIHYLLSIPANYIERMGELEKQYNIELTDREKHILALNPTRESRGLLHLSSEIEILSVGGDVTTGWDFVTPIPTTSAGYMVKIDQNGSGAVVEIRIKK